MRRRTCISPQIIWFHPPLHRRILFGVAGNRHRWGSRNSKEGAYRAGIQPNRFVLHSQDGKTEVEYDAHRLAGAATLNLTQGSGPIRHFSGSQIHTVNGELGLILSVTTGSTTGRIQRNLDAEFPQFTTAMLGVLHPQLVQPVPPMAIARFDVDPCRMELPTGYTIPKNTPLIARSADGLPCRFRTSYPVKPWPLELNEAVLEPAKSYDFITPEATSILRFRSAAPPAH